MRNVAISLILPLTLILFPAAANADAIATASMTLNGLQILPANGSVLILPSVNAGAQADTDDSSFGLNPRFSTVTDGDASASMFTTLENATSNTSAPTLTATGSTSVNLPENAPKVNCAPYACAFANSTAFSSLDGSFEIVGTSAPVSVEMIVSLSYVQAALTNLGPNESAESVVHFSLFLPDITSDALDFINDLLLGSNDVAADAGSPILATSVLLQPDTPYRFGAVLVSFSSASIVPEPSSWLLLLTVTAIWLVRIIVLAKQP